MHPVVSRSDLEEMDLRDPIGESHGRFRLPDDIVYLDGNSLGPPPEDVFARLNTVLAEEWGAGLVGSWNQHGWIDLQREVSAKIAPLIGAAEDEVVVADSTSVNLFKLLSAGLRLRRGRRVMLSETGNFGTDLYIAQGLADLLGDRARLKMVDRRHLESALDDDVAVLMLTHVDFRTGAMHDMKMWTDRAHEAGALVLWDLAHSAGAMPVDLDSCGADLAVGCGYKYLNGGPGAPSFCFVARQHHRCLESPLWGWMGHEAPFDFDPTYRPADGVQRLFVGTPPILSLAALQCGVESVAGIGVERLRVKSLAMTELFMTLVEQRCEGHGFEIVTPRQAERRGSQVALRHPQAFSIMQALIAAGVVGDFRAPDLMRFGFAPAYLRFVDVWEAVERLGDIMDQGKWDRPEHRVRPKVT